MVSHQVHQLSKQSCLNIRYLKVPSFNMLGSFSELQQSFDIPSSCHLNYSDVLNLVLEIQT